jgi:hypothetical protein
MRSCRREVQRMRAKLSRILSRESPMAELEALQIDIVALVDRHIVEGSWPFSPVCPDADSRAEPEVLALVTKFGSGWEAPPPAGRTSPAGAAGATGPSGAASATRASGATGANGTTGTLGPAVSGTTSPSESGGEDHG